MSSWRSRRAIRSRAAGRSSLSNSTASADFSASSARVWLCTERTATGTATSAVTITATTAVATVTRTARPVRVRKKSRIGGVPDTPDGPDQAGGGAELRPDLSHVHVDRAGAGVRGVPPDRGQQLLPGEHPSGTAQQVGQQIELGGGQGQRDAGHR